LLIPEAGKDTRILGLQVWISLKRIFQLIGNRGSACCWVVMKTFARYILPQAYSTVHTLPFQVPKGTFYLAQMIREWSFPDLYIWYCCQYYRYLYRIVLYLIKIFIIDQKAVFRIHEILGWIRIRIRGSMPLTSGSGFGSGPDPGSKIKSQKEPQNSRNQGFSY
jgi:hypothetical protein